MGQVKHIRNAADLLVGIDQLRRFFIVAGKARRQLPPVLQIDEHVGDQPGYRPLVQVRTGGRGAVQPVDCGDATFVMNPI